MEEFLCLVWASDFTYIGFQGYFIYLATIIDIYSREIVGWNISSFHDTDLILGALKHAIKRTGKTPVYLHSDQGSEYDSNRYEEFAVYHKVNISMSAKSSPWENGFHSLPIVLKLFNKIGDVDAEKRFHQENIILKKITPHVRIINPLSHVVVNGSYTYYLMEKADYSLHAYHSQQRKLGIDEIKNFMTGICEGLQHAHKNEVAHRDLYWNNVLLMNSTGVHEVKLTDFGLAKDFSLQDLSAIPNQIWGCFLIQPPEYKFRIWDDPKVRDYFFGDIFALGMLLFYLFDWFPSAHAFRVEGEILSILKKNNVDLITSPVAEREKSYKEWLSSSGSGFYKDLLISYADLDIMNKANSIIQKLCNPDYTKRYTNIDNVIEDISSL